ncbi:MAG: ASCH domain-containing protein [Patescibacteria group bacterium]
MKAWVLRIRKTDKVIFDRIKNGEKTVETRPMNAPESSKYYGQMKTGDRLVILCDGQRLEKFVKATRVYKDFEKYLDSEDLKNILGEGTTKESARKVHYSFGRERLDKYGIIAIDMESR